MSLKLCNDDRCAVDLLLERNGGTTPTTLCYSNASSAMLQQRMDQVDRVLKLLSHYRPGEPAPDLVARTLARCAEESTAIHPQAPLDATIARSQA